MTDPGFWKRLHSIPTKRPPLTDKILSLIAREMMEEAIPASVLAKIFPNGEPENQLTYARGIAQAWLEGALSGNAELLKVLLDRTEGKVPQPATLDVNADITVTHQLADRIGDAIKRLERTGT